MDTIKKKKTVVFAPVLEQEQQKVLIARENIVEDVILLMNPKYDYYSDAAHFLRSMKFNVYKSGPIKLTHKQMRSLVARRYKESSYCDDIIDHFADEQWYYFHVTKLNAQNEVDILMRKHFTKWPDIFEYKLLEKPYKPEMFPFLFFPMDSRQMYEDALKIVAPDLIEFWGQDVKNMAYVDKAKIVNFVMQTTVGDGVKVDAGASQYAFKDVFDNPVESKSIHYVADTAKQGRFEVKIQNKYGTDNSKSKIEKKRAKLLDKFHSLSMYYTRLCKITDDLCPSFYRFRIQPDTSTKLQKAYEVEEYSGNMFMYQVLHEAKVHRKYEKPSTSNNESYFQSYLSKQGSLPAYTYGFKLAKMAEKLQEVTYNEIAEVGQIRFNRGEFYAPTPITEFLESEFKYYHKLMETVTPMVKNTLKSYQDDSKLKEFTEKIEDILHSYTFKESRKHYNVRLVPDRIDPINLRIYNKSEFVTDVFLKELEQRLNVELESIAREKYFQGIGGSREYNLAEKYEKLKRDDTEYKDPDVLLRETKEKLFEAKHSTPHKMGSFYAKDPKEIEKFKEAEKSSTLRDISRNWVEDDDFYKDIPDLTQAKQEMVDKKGVAISGVKPAKYSKEHVAAAIFFFINFTMKVEKREELLTSGIMENEQELDLVIDGLITAFEQNYSTFETMHKKPEFLENETQLEQHFKGVEKLKKRELQERKEDEEYQRYLRWTCSPEEALEMVANDMRQRKEEHREIIRDGYVVRDDAMFVEELSKGKYKNRFLKAAEHGIIDNTNLGPVLEFNVEEVMTKYQDKVVFEDKLSFFRMEYMLYCLRELDGMDQDAYYFKDDIAYYKKKLSEVDSDIQRMKFNFGRLTIEEKNKLDAQQKEFQKYREKLQKIDTLLVKKKYIMRRLVDHMINWKVKGKKVHDNDHYGIGLDTFWLPLDFNEDIETDYDSEKYRLDGVEKVKRQIVDQYMRNTDPKLLSMKVADRTVPAKHKRTALGYYNFSDEKEELIFKKLIPLAEKTSNEILAVVPEKIRETFRNI